MAANKPLKSVPATKNVASTEFANARRLAGRYASYENSLALAPENNCYSIAFPAIFCGAIGFPAKTAAKIAIEVCSKERYRHIKIYFYLRGKDMFDIWQQAYDNSST